MTDTEERALLRRLVVLVPSKLGCRDFHHSKADRHDGSDCPIEKRIDAALNDAYALLAQPAPEGVVEKMPPVERFITRLCAKDYNGFEERKADVRKVVTDFLAAYRPLPRAETEPMVTMAKAIDAAQNEDGVTENHAPKHFSNEAAFGWRIGYEDGQNSVQQHLDSVMETARAALLAALCGEEKP